VLIVYDLEGPAGVQSSRAVSFGASGYAAARASLTAEVNAAIRGLLRAGASEVVLTDGHGSGNPDPDYDTSQLPERARHDIREVAYDPYIDACDGSFDAVVAIGMHSRAGGSGFLSHTYYGHTRWELNGLNLNESMIVAASAARFGIPLILVSGDDALQEEVTSFNPRIRYVVTKQALSRIRAEPRPEEEVVRELEAKAEDALRALDGIPAWSPAPAEGDWVSLFSYTRPEHASLAIEFPGAWEVNDRTIGLRTGDFLDAYLAFRALANFTALAPMRTIVDAMREVEGGMETYARIREHLADLPRPGFESAGDRIDRSKSARGKHGYR
jgi:D-amino peptidase